MIRFESDYLEGALPEVMQALNDTNFAQTPGYGEDEYCEEARALIREKCAAPEADVHFLVGGTQANMIVIAAALRPHQAAIAAETGHIAVHETGSIEATGHKVITLKSGDGKISAGQVRECVEAHWNDATHEHMAQPALVYISQPTENGTLYSLAELEELGAVCREKGLIFFVDGARLGTALVSGDATLADLARLTDVFYIGGTKVGALCGEAVVFPHGAPAHFMTMVKQQGALLAKGRLMGLQFDVLFTDGLYTEISKNAIETAAVLKKGLAEKGYQFFMDSPTNQIFVVFPNAQLEALEGKAKFGFWEKYDDTHTVMRIATSWATRMEEVRQLLALL